MSLPDKDSDGKLPAYAWPGGYPIAYVDKDNSILCAKCATKSSNDPDELPNFKPVDCFIHYAGESEFCEQCNAEIESAYGIPD